MQIEQWKLNDNPDQNKYARKCKKINGFIDHKMKEKVRLMDKRVIDKQTHKVLTEQIKNQILYFLNMESKVKQKQTIKVQGVKNSKLTSTKARQLKNNELINTMRSIKHQFDQMEQMGNRTARI